MSLKVLVVPEDPTYNGAILQPVVERILLEVGKPNAVVKVLTDPKLNGISDAKRAIREELPSRYKHVPLWLFIPDADQAGNLRSLEEEMQARGIPLLCCAAQPEVEVWLLVGFRNKLGLDWEMARRHSRFRNKLGLDWEMARRHSRLKEKIFAPFLAQNGDRRLPDGGRGELTRETLKNYRGLRKVCPEIAEFEERIARFLAHK